MKVACVLFLVVLAVGSGLTLTSFGHVYYKPINQRVRDLIVRQGYRAQNITVQTDDGYILDIVRIPRGYEELSQQEMETFGKTVPLYQERTNKEVVVLMPGMMSTFEDFVAGGRHHGLAFALADVAYDVFIVNPRGSTYGQRHVNLDSEKDPAFWKFCWHDIGTKDLPAVVDTIISITGENRLYFVGHMQGATAFYVMASEKPEYNRKIMKMLSLGPVAYMGNSKHHLLKHVEEELKSLENSVPEEGKTSVDSIWNGVWVMKNIGLHKFTPSSEVLAETKESCRNTVNEDKKQLCDDIYFLMNGYNSENLNETTVNHLLQRLPSPTPTRSVLHYVQLMMSGRFQKYNANYKYGEDNEEEYDLKKVTTPVTILYAKDDPWSQQADIEKLQNSLGNVLYTQKVTSATNNLDLLFSKDVYDNVYSNVIGILKQRQQRA